MQVLHAFGAVERRLGLCITNALQDGLNRQRGPRGKRLGKERSLIKAALTLFRRMQRDWDNDIESRRIEADIVQHFAQPIANQVSQIEVFVIFEFVDEPAHDAAGAVTGNGRFEVEGLVGAVAAGKRAGDRAGKWLGAFGTEWWDNSRRASLTVGAQIFVGSYARSAAFTHRRIEQRKRCS
jgi:hypothetical protein